MHKLPRAPIASLSPAAEGVSKRPQRRHAPALITPSNNQPPALPPPCRASGATRRAAPEPSGCTPSSCSAHGLRRVQGRTGGETPTASGFGPVGEGAAAKQNVRFHCRYPQRGRKANGRAIEQEQTRCAGAELAGARSPRRSWRHREFPFQSICSHFQSVLFKGTDVKTLSIKAPRKQNLCCG